MRASAPIHDRLLYFLVLSTFALRVGLVAGELSTGRRLQRRSGQARRQGIRADRAVKETAPPGSGFRHGRLAAAASEPPPAFSGIDPSLPC